MPPPEWPLTLNRNDNRSRNVLTLVKQNGERYTFIYTDDQRAECLRMLGRFAAHEDLSFTWYDASLLSQKIRQEAKGGAA